MNIYFWELIKNCCLLLLGFLVKISFLVKKKNGNNKEKIFLTAPREAASVCNYQIATPRRCVVSITLHHVC